MTKVALCFPGQGSQSAGMAEGLFDEPLAHELFAEGKAVGLDLEAALHGSDDQLRATEVAQPALFFVEVVLAAALPKELTIVGVAGHSVGEYAAAVAAHALEPRDALRIVVERGRAMADAPEGTMAAVLGLDRETVESICHDVAETSGDIVVAANINAPGHVVVSGTRPGVDRVAEQAKKAGARRVIPLNVSGAFHSPLMETARQRLSVALDSVTTHAPRVPLFSNVDAKPVTTAEGLQQRLGEQLIMPVLWTECIEQLVNDGADVFVEVGPGSVLTGLARRIAPSVRAVHVSTLAEAHALLTTITAAVGAPS